MKAQILVIDEDAEFSRSLSDLLGAEEYAVEVAGNAATGVARILEGEYDLMILDILLPDRNGLAVCKQIRQRGIDMPILVVTWCNQVRDCVQALKFGADDYLTKPVDPTELMARMENLLRRSRKWQEPLPACCEFGNVQVNFGTGEVRKDGIAVSLSAKELQMLGYLASRRGKLVTREELLRHVWPFQPDVSMRSVDVQIANLRLKLEDYPSLPRYLVTVRGAGYRFA